MTVSPIGAGPGRKMARIRVRGQFHPSYGEDLPDPDTLGFQIYVPVSVTFDLDLRVDTLSFEEPLTMVWDLIPPGELDKPHVRQATRIHLVDVVDAAWGRAGRPFGC